MQFFSLQNQGQISPPLCLPPSDPVMPPAASPPPSLPSRWLLYCGLLSWKRPVVDERRSAGSHSRVAGVHVSALHINWDFCLLRKPCVEQFPRPSGNKKKTLAVIKRRDEIKQSQARNPKNICFIGDLPSSSRAVGRLLPERHTCVLLHLKLLLPSLSVYPSLPADGSKHQHGDGS